MYDRDDLDFNEVFFTDVRVPAENLVGPLGGGWQVANGSLGHERTLMWMAFANRLEQLLEDYRPADEVNRRPLRHHRDGLLRTAAARLERRWAARPAVTSTWRACPC